MQLTRILILGLGKSMRRLLAAGTAALGVLLIATSAADAAAAAGGARGGGGAFRGGGGFRGGEFRGGGFRGGEFRGGRFYGGGFRGGFFGPRVGFGIGFYDPFWSPWYDPWYYPYYYRPEVVVRYAPPAGSLPPPNTPAPQEYWYRCGNPEGYYPYIRQCNSGWEQVPATPQNAPAPAPPPR